MSNVIRHLSRCALEELHWLRQQQNITTLHHCSNRNRTSALYAVTFRSRTCTTASNADAAVPRRRATLVDKNFSFNADGVAVARSHSKVEAVAKSKIAGNRQQLLLTTDLERNEATVVVDNLLERTRLMMCNNDNDDGNNSNINMNQYQHTIAFSGGVDSSLVAALVYRNCRAFDTTTTNNNNNHSTSANTTTAARTIVQAVMGVSPAVSAEQLRAAEAVAAAIGIPFVTVPTMEGQNATYLANAGQACLACKTELYRTLQAIVHHATTTTTTIETAATTTDRPAGVLLYNGTNQDDTHDVTRLGLVAARRYHVRSPLDQTTKTDVRLAARHLGLPNWQAAASPCLRSRLALHVPATVEHLQRIERAERFVRQQLSLQFNSFLLHTPNATGYDDNGDDVDSGAVLLASTNLRVRLLPQQQACIEIDHGVAMDALLSAYDSDRSFWENVFFNELKFAGLTIRPFRSGSVSRPIPQGGATNH